MTNQRPHFWQWPNILGLDAVIIAVTWQWMIKAENATLEISSSLVLGLSVWLTYLADRLFDIQKTKNKPLNSIRHQFMRSRKSVIWPLWWLILGLNVSLAITLLPRELIFRGVILLLATLGYVYCTQKIKNFRFPKEIAVGIIFTAGILIFHESAISLAVTIPMTLLFTSNCLMLSEKERVLDQALEQHSWGTLPWIIPITLFLTLISAIGFLPVALPASLMLICCYQFRAYLKSETYRVLVDASLLTSPFIWGWLA
jgi:hypothetical protein